MAQMDMTPRDPKSGKLISLGFCGSKWNNYEALFNPFPK
ncbi:hypothetical protein PY32053_02283 [Paracoccus yeei]|uniref:Uncharacterized protein n=1 Tax=Paracoccus yeei TaxID=147645 RepID=A0A386UP53_9RHOB|nr:hypothetical protein PY32053_02283 [Paracoccus yeei]